MALQQHGSLCFVYPLARTPFLPLDPGVLSVMTRGGHPSATLTVAPPKLPNPQGWSESLSVCT